MLKPLLLLLIGLTATLSADSFDSYDQFIEQARVQYKVPGVAVVIVKEDKVIFSKGYGTTRFDGTQKVDENTIFQLASVSKTFAVAGLGVQVDKGKLQWEDEIIQHLPEFALKELYSSRFATSVDLLAHRTGLPAFGGDLLGQLGYFPSEVLERAREIKPETSFRNKGLYSNVGFFIAGRLLAKIANSTWEDAIQNTLLDPMQMTRTGFGKILDGSNVAFAHAILDGKMQVIPWDRSEVFVSAGGVMSTGSDMAKWMLMHLNQGRLNGKQILKQETVEKIFTPVIAIPVNFTDMPPIDSSSGLTFALGWNPYHYKGHVIVEKSGALDGVRSIVTLIPDQKVGITVLANLNLSVLPELIRAKFLEDQLGKYEENLEKIFAERQEKVAEIIKPPKKTEKENLPLGHRLEQYLGTFESELFGTFTVVKDGSNLSLIGGPGKLKGKLRAWSNDTFLLSWPMVNSGYDPVTFTFGPDGNAVSFKSDAFGDFISN